MTGPAAFVALAAAALPAAPATPPVFLVAREDGDIVHLQVRGEAAVSLVARFMLETTSGSNRALQRGTAKLSPGKPVVLVTLNLSGRDKGWSARLRVEPDGAAPYELVLPAR